MAANQFYCVVCADDTSSVAYLSDDLQRVRNYIQPFVDEYVEDGSAETELDAWIQLIGNHRDCKDVSFVISKIGLNTPANNNDSLHEEIYEHLLPKKSEPLTIIPEQMMNQYVEEVRGVADTPQESFLFSLDTGSDHILTKVEASSKEVREAIFKAGVDDQNPWIEYEIPGQLKLCAIAGLGTCYQQADTVLEVLQKFKCREINQSYGLQGCDIIFEAEQEHEAPELEYGSEHEAEESEHEDHEEESEHEEETTKPLKPLKPLSKVYYDFKIKVPTEFQARLRYIGTDYDHHFAAREGEVLHYFTKAPVDDDDEIMNDDMLILRTKGDRKCFSFVYMDFDGMYDSEQIKDADIESDCFE